MLISSVDKTCRFVFPKFNLPCLISSKTENNYIQSMVYWQLFLVKLSLKVMLLSRQRAEDLKTVEVLGSIHTGYRVMFCLISSIFKSSIKQLACRTEFSLFRIWICIFILALILPFTNTGKSQIGT